MPRKRQKVRCKCCGYRTLTTGTDFEICPVCGWSPDPYSTPNEIRGPNRVSLETARSNFEEFGAITKTMEMQTRPPNRREKQ